MQVVSGAVQALGSAAGGAMLRVDVLDVSLEHVVAGYADAVDSVRRFLSVVSSMRVFGVFVFRIVVAHGLTVSSCDAPMTPERTQAVC
jgi:hypothetical protein